MTLYPDWMNRSTCGQMVASGELSTQQADNLFFEQGSPRAAQRICARCPVTRECGEWAERNLIEYGVYAGEQGGRRRERLGITIDTALTDAA